MLREYSMRTQDGLLPRGLLLTRSNLRKQPLFGDESRSLTVGACLPPWKRRPPLRGAPFSSYNRFITERLFLGFLAAILAFAIYNAGGPYTGYDVCLLGVGLTAAAYSLLTRPELETTRAPWLLLFPGYVALQLLPLPLFLLRLISPARASILDSLRWLMPSAAFAALSTNSALTVIQFMRIIAYVLFFLVVRDVSCRLGERKGWLMAMPLIAIATAEAVLGLLQNARAEEVQGTYINKNHFAGLLEMALPLTAAYALSLFARRSNAKAAGMLSVALLMIAGLVCSLSKMGFAAGLAGLFVLGALAIAGRVQGGKKWLVIGGLAALVLFGFVFLPSDAFIANYGGLMTTSQAALEGRGPIWRETLQLIAAYPAFGIGLGNYETAFLKYQAQVVDRVFTYAHNDYLQTAAELGVIGLAIAAVLLLPIFARAFRAASHGPDRTSRYLGLGCAAAIAAICLHSVTDFNMYVPANAFVLAWICGIAASLPLRRDRANSVAASQWSKRLVLALALLLIVYAPLRIVFDSQFRSDWRAEGLFCRFGICDLDAVMTAQTLAHGGNAGAVPVPYLLEALRRDPNAPARWCDTGEAMLRAGRSAAADYCFTRALYLGPHIPPILMQAADFYDSTHRTGRALNNMARVLMDTSAYDPLIFAWYSEKQIPVPEVLASGLPPGQRAAEAYLRDLMARGDAGAGQVWEWTTARGLAGAGLAREYLEYLFAKREYQTAAMACARYLGTRRNGYLESNWIFNGDFERELSDFPMDWRIDAHEGVEVGRDAQVAHTGSQSMRIRFAGRENLEYNGVQQSAYVTPGNYVFEAYVRTENLTTDRGIGFHIYDRESTSRLDVRTKELTGTRGFTRIALAINVPKATRLLAIVVSRCQSMKFDNQIGGAAWVDSVRLSPQSQSLPDSAATARIFQ